MQYGQLIEDRKSIRSFKRKPISEEDKREIQEYFPKAQRLIPEISTQLLVFTDADTKNRLEGVAGYMGKAFGAPCYLVLLTEKAPNSLINAGYLTEDILLKLTELEVDACWITVNDSESVKRALLIDSEMDVASIIACGYGKPEVTLKRLDIVTPSTVNFRERAGHVAPKIAQDELVSFKDFGTPVDWDKYATDPALDKAFYAASLAPSFLNRQPYRYILRQQKIALCIKQEDMVSREDTLLDLGATMLNFTVIFEHLQGPTPDRGWTIGKPSCNDELDLPEGWIAAATYQW